MNDPAEAALATMYSKARKMVATLMANADPDFHGAIVFRISFQDGKPHRFLATTEESGIFAKHVDTKKPKGTIYP